MRPSLLALLVLVPACGTSGSGPAPVADAGVSIDLAADGATGGEDAASAPDGGSCARPAGDPDRPRKVVISHPFDANGNKATAFEVLDLAPSGMLTRGGATFQMGTALERPIRFTRDGAIGLVAQDDGSIGAFRIDEAGHVTVVHAAFRDGFYANDVLIADDGSRAWVLDADTVDNGGGLYELSIACDGTLASRGRVAQSSGAFAGGLVPGGAQAVIAATQLLASPGMDDVDLVALGGARPTLAASGSAFGDGMAIASSVDVAPDGKYALVTDNGYTVGSRVATVALPSMKPVQLLMIANPAQAIVSPFGNAALVLSSDGKDAIRLLHYDPANAAAPFAVVGEIAYENGKPQLPSSGVVVARGKLEGMVLVAENEGVRQVQLTAAGDAQDLALLGFGEALDTIVGVIGVQP